MSFALALDERGEHEELRRLVAEAIAQHRGNLVAASHDLGLSWQGIYRFVRRYGLWGLVRSERAKATAPPSWLIRTLSVLEGGRMAKIEELYQAAAGMSVEEIAAEVEASEHAGMVDAAQLAEAIAAGAASMASPEG